MSSCTATEASGSSTAVGSSLFDSFSSTFSTFFTTAKADEGNDEKDDDDKEDGDDKEEGGDEEEEDDEPEDPLPAIYEDCENSKQCAPAKHHFLECQERVEAGNGFKDENCVEEFFHLAHCASECSAPRVFHQLK